MARKKLHKFADIHCFPEVFLREDENAKEKLKSFLGGDADVILELGCGRGAYAVGLAEAFPEKKCVGVDIQGERLWYGAKAVREKNLSNVAFLRAQIEHLEEYFSAHSLGSIVITFPDPFPRKGHAKRRLSSPRFLSIYKSLLKPDGRIHFKTDNSDLFEYTLKTAESFGVEMMQIERNVQLEESNPFLNIQTYYEKRYRSEGKPIYYCCFQFTR